VHREHSNTATQHTASITPHTVYCQQAAAMQHTKTAFAAHAGLVAFNVLVVRARPHHHGTNHSVVLLKVGPFPSFSNYLSFGS